ncbi:hypothetical protein Thiosp_01751 [Thiorhodovibrio litoralis]|nr:hypothetical protein Thiosp_01751 [Thiorhodovibrio litoralis]
MNFGAALREQHQTSQCGWIGYVEIVAGQHAQTRGASLDRVDQRGIEQGEPAAFDERDGEIDLACAANGIEQSRQEWIVSPACRQVETHGLGGFAEKRVKPALCFAAGPQVTRYPGFYDAQLPCKRNEFGETGLIKVSKAPPIVLALATTVFE